MKERLGRESLALQNLQEKFQQYLVAEKIQKSAGSYPIETKLASYKFL